MSIVGYVEHCFRYPVKGCQGIVGDIAVEPSRGIWRDRRFVVVSDSKTSDRFPYRKAITQREFPGMATMLVEEVSGESFRLLYAQGEERQSAWFAGYSERDKRGYEQLTVHDPAAPVFGVRIGGEVESFFEGVLGIPVCFYEIPYRLPRAHRSKHLARDLHLGFADSHPVLLTNTSSLAELNRGLSGTSPIVPMSRFRPNIVVSAPEPWAEDTWKIIRIGKTVLEFSQACGRCQVVTIDQHTGIVDVNQQPLRYLNSFRPARGAPTFGAYYAIREGGSISTHMPLERLA